MAVTAAAVELVLHGALDDAVRARAFAETRLCGAPEELRDDARLLLSELVTNAALHGTPPIRVRVDGWDGEGIRIEVEDVGRQLLVLPAPSTDAMTGRGLSLVAALSCAWGVAAGSDGGKVVWAELRADGAQPSGQGPDEVDDPELDVEALLAAWQDEEPEPLFRVRLGAVPTDMLLAAKRHIDNVVRELTLARAGAQGGQPLPAQLEALVETVTGTFSRARAEIKRQAAAAAARGDVETELVLTLPASAAEAGEEYLRALDEADRYARDARLLTLETPRLHALFRRWYVQALVDQLRTRSGGREPVPPRSFTSVLSDEVTALSALRGTARRLALLQQVNAELTAVDSAEDMAAVIVRSATESLDALAARVHLVDGDVLRTLAAAGGSASWYERFREIPVDSDLPGAQVFRTGEARALVVQPRADARFAELAELGDDQLMHLVPVTVGTHRLGLLMIDFPARGELDEPSQGAFVRALADALAQALERHLAEQALRSERDVVSSLHQVGLAVTSRLDIDEVVQTVTDAATLGTGAQFGAFFYNKVDDSGEAYALYAVSGVPRSAFDRFPMPRNTAVFAPTFAGQGTVRLADVTADPRYGRTPPHHGMPQGHLPVRSYLAVPVVLTSGEVAGGLFFGHADAGVFDDEAEQLAVGIAGYAAIALDNARLYEAARRESRLKEQIAVALERPLQPPVLPEVPGVELAGLIEPFQGGDGLGGDFYDAFELPCGRWFVALGDVSGKGPEAAAVTGLVRATLWASAQQGSGLVSVLQVLNAALLRQECDRFATVVAALVAPAEDGVLVEAVWAGHAPGLLLAGGGVQQAGGGGIPLGMFPDVDLRARTILVPEGTTLLLHTDGLVERAGAVLGDEDLQALVRQSDQPDLPALLTDLVARVDALHPRRDDIALLALRASRS